MKTKEKKYKDRDYILGLIIGMVYLMLPIIAIITLHKLMQIVYQ